MVALLLGTSITLRLLGPQVVRYFVDTAFVDGALQAVGPAVALYAALALGQQAAAVAVTYLTEDLGWAATNRLRTDLALHCLRLDLTFHYRHTPGELIERVDGDVSRLAGFFSRFVVLVAGNALLLLGVVAALWREDWRFGAGFGAALLTGAALYRAALRVPVRYWEAERQADAEFVGFVEERLAGTEDLRANGATEYVMRSLYGVLRRLLERARSAWLSTGALNTAWQAFRALGGLLTLGLGWWLFAHGAVSLGTVYLVGWYFTLAIWPVAEIDEQLEDLQRATASVGRIAQLLEERSALASPVMVKALPAGPLAVEFEHVHFTYPRTAAGPAVGAARTSPALRDVSFRLEAGRTLGVVGRTGSGKSTLGRLLFRFYDVTAGSVRLGGVDVRDAPLEAVRRRVSIVTQEVQLLHATVRENLTFFGAHTTEAQILAALRALGLEEWYAALPQGMDTPLGAAGAGLSAGQAQLLALTRAFVRQPDAVILDEASSRLDPLTERLAGRAIQRLLAGRTALVIAHRLATLRRVDDVLVLEHGQVVEHGARADLAADPCSRFSHLLRTRLEVLA